MKNNRVLAILAIGLLITNFLSLAMLWLGRPEGDGGRRGSPEPVLQILRTELHWTDEQVKRFEGLRNEHASQTRSLMDSSRLLRDQYFSLLGKVNIGDARLDSLGTSIGSMEKEKQSITFDHFSKVRGICTPEQQTKFDGVIQEVLRKAFGPQGGGDRRPPPRK